jgi:putative MATE family efflux protein
MDMETAFEQEGIGKLLLRLSVPGIIAQMVNLLYNIIDRIFLGRFVENGSLVLAGLGTVLPVTSIITAFTYLIGYGGGPLAAISLGKKDLKRAEKILGNCWQMMVILAVVLTVVGRIFGKNILSFMGADEAILPYAYRYFNIYVIGTVFVFASMGLSPFLITQGFNRIVMRNNCIGALLNIVLDFLFIYCFQMGIEGAAYATIISQAVSGGLNIAFLFGRETRLRIRCTSFSGKLIGQILVLGASTFFMGVTESLVQSIFYSQLGRYGNTLYISALAAVYSVQQMIFLPVQGISQGAQPIISYNYGAGNRERLQETIRTLLFVLLVYSVTATLLVECFPAFWIGIFLTDQDVVQIAARCLRFFVMGRVVMGVQFTCQETFRSVNFGKAAIYVAAVRKLVFMIPLAYLLPLALGAEGVFWAEGISDFISVANAGTLYLILRKRIMKSCEKNKAVVEENAA